MNRNAMVLLLGVLEACGPSGGSHAEMPGCSAELAGNYAESSWSVTHCPKLAAGVGATQGDTLLQFTIASRALHGAYAISLDLGRSPTPGASNSGTTDLWTAVGTKIVPPGGACLFQAGNNVTPTGDFVLDLTAIDRTAAHGTLAVRMFVLPRASDDGNQTDCGAGTTEQLQLRF